MNIKVYAFALVAFTVGLVELIIGGVLPKIAEDLQITLSQAGRLITVFALVYAVSGPTLLALTAKYERKKLFMIAMTIFSSGCLVAFFSQSYEVLLISRIITAISGALITVLSLTIAVTIVEARYRARAVGIVIMGVSMAIVLGVPLGVLFSEYIGWRYLFLFIACLSLLMIILMFYALERTQPEKVIPLKTQIASLRNRKIISAHLVTFFALTGHYTLYAYFTPFLEQEMNVTAFAISVAYFTFGFAAIIGGWIGGYLSDRIGAKKSIYLFLSLFALTMFMIPYLTGAFTMLLAVIAIWGTLSWAISPPQQSYLIQTAPETASIQQSVNLTFLQIGIASGAAVGGFIYERSHSFYAMSSLGGALVVCAFLLAVYSITKKANNEKLN